MRHTTRLLASIAIGALLASATILGQSISIEKKTDNKYWIDATAPADVPHSLQVSENLHLWMDITNAVPRQFSMVLTEESVTTRFFRIAPTPPEPAPVRIVIVGDSMASDCCGWGGGLPQYFKPNAAVINYAQPWTSSKIFLQSAEYDKMLLIRPDYVLLQFGWTDGSVDPDRGVSPADFRENLRSLVKTIRGFNGTPILVTVHAARSWDSSGALLPSDHIFNTITREVAAELKTPLVDLYQITKEMFTKLGQSGCAFFHWEPGGPDDVMHFSPLGGIYVAQALTHALPDALGQYLTEIFTPPPKP